MPTPGEYKTVQSRILAYAQQIGWTYVPRREAEKRRGFDHTRDTPAEQAAERLLTSMIFTPGVDGLLEGHTEMPKLDAEKGRRRRG